MLIFKTRTPDRDRETDRQRLRHLTDLLRTIIAEMTVERDGLEARRHKTKEDAAFSLVALEEDGDRRLSTKVDQLTASLVTATDRAKSLQDQIAFMRRLLEEVTTFGERSRSKPGATVGD